MAEPVACDVSKALKKTPNGKVKKIPLDLTPIGQPRKIAYLLKNVFDPEECQKLIELTEAAGYTQALIHSGSYAAPAPGYRDSQRIMVDDKEFVNMLFKRIGHLLPQTFKNVGGQEYELVEINERLRFLRYDKGDKFEQHCDGAYERPDGLAITKVTLQIYLNEKTDDNDLVGGETTFLEYKRPGQEQSRVPVVPTTGMVLVFEHNILHEGSLVHSGRKYTIRTDVLYRVKDDEGSDEDEEGEPKPKKQCRVA